MDIDDSDGESGSHRCATGRSFQFAKVGGSLFDLPDLTTRLRRWMERSRSRRVVLLAGGGAGVDAIRERYSLGRCDVVEAHWTSIRVMSDNSARLCAMLGVQLARSFADCEADRSGTVVLDARAELEADNGETLPVGWHVTSDSIAAWCSIRLGGRSLSLLKSVGGDRSVTLESASSNGWLDAHFPNLAGELSEVTWVNLRHDPPLESSLLLSHEKFAGS